MRRALLSFGAIALVHLAFFAPGVRADTHSPIASKISLAAPLSLRIDVAPLTGEHPAVRSTFGTSRRLFIDGQDRPTVPMDERRARRGAFLLAAGIPLAVTGTATWILGAALPETDYCGNPQAKRETMLAGGAMSMVGIGFSSGAIVALRRTTHEARRARSRRTRAGIIVTGLVSSGIGLGILSAAGVGAICLAS